MSPRLTERVDHHKYYERIIVSPTPEKCFINVYNSFTNMVTFNRKTNQIYRNSVSTNRCLAHVNYYYKIINEGNFHWQNHVYTSDVFYMGGRTMLNKIQNVEKTGLRMFETWDKNLDILIAARHFFHLSFLFDKNRDKRWTDISAKWINIIYDGYYKIHCFEQYLLAYNILEFIAPKYKEIEFLYKGKNTLKNLHSMHPDWHSNVVRENIFEVKQKIYELNNFK